MSYTPDELTERVNKLEERANKQDVMLAVINTKLTVIVWLTAAIVTAVIGVIVKMVVGA